MGKKVLAAASYYMRKYYRNPELKALPQDVETELKILCSVAAEKIHGVFVLGFYQDGTLYAEANGQPDDDDFSETIAKAEVDELMKEKQKLADSLKLWYRYFIYQGDD